MLFRRSLRTLKFERWKERSLLFFFFFFKGRRLYCIRTGDEPLLIIDIWLQCLPQAVLFIQRSCTSLTWVSVIPTSPSAWSIETLVYFSLCLVAARAEIKRQRFSKTVTRRNTAAAALSVRHTFGVRHNGKKSNLFPFLLRQAVCELACGINVCLCLVVKDSGWIFLFFLWLSVKEIKADLTQDVTSDSLESMILSKSVTMKQTYHTGNTMFLGVQCLKSIIDYSTRKKSCLFYVLSLFNDNNVSIKSLESCIGKAGKKCDFPLEMKSEVSKCLWTTTKCRFLLFLFCKLKSSVFLGFLSSAGERYSTVHCSVWTSNDWEKKASRNCIRECLWGFARWLPVKQNNSALVYNTVDHAPGSETEEKKKKSHALQRLKDENSNQIILVSRAHTNKTHHP